MDSALREVVPALGDPMTPAHLAYFLCAWTLAFAVWDVVTGREL